MASDTSILDLVRQAGTVVEIPVAWGEMDALGHVNNVVYFRYMETSRIAFIRALGWDRGVSDGGGAGFILQSVQCRFRRPVVFPDVVRVTSRLTEIGEDRFTLAHDLISERLGEVAAIGSGTIVTYDYAAGSKMRIPGELRTKLEAELARVSALMA
jgi:acyl-CoA thioester hydrolase